jgi:hypothetical protein
MKNTFIKIGGLYAEYFFKNGEEKGYALIQYKSVVMILCSLYRFFMLDSIPSIESLPEVDKYKYFAFGKKYYYTRNKIIEASKAAYVLSLITASE